jgi:hypothetical protein
MACKKAVGLSRENRLFAMLPSPSPPLARKFSRPGSAYLRKILSKFRFTRDSFSALSLNRLNWFVFRLRVAAWVPEFLMRDRAAREP